MRQKPGGHGPSEVLGDGVGLAPQHMYVYECVCAEARVQPWGSFLRHNLS